jgi:hypothetical protein
VLFGATLDITRPTKEPAPMPFTTSPIIPVFKLEPIPRLALLARLRIILRFAIGFLLDVRLFIVFVIRLLVVVFRLFGLDFFVDFRLNPPLFIILANFLLAASCLAVAIID